MVSTPVPPRCVDVVSLLPSSCWPHAPLRLRRNVEMPSHAAASLPGYVSFPLCRKPHYTRPVPNAPRRVLSQGSPSHPRREYEAVQRREPRLTKGKQLRRRGIMRWVPTRSYVIRLAAAPQQYDIANLTHVGALCQAAGAAPAGSPSRRRAQTRRSLFFASRTPSPPEATTPS